jgi:hypothetical protein
MPETAMVEAARRARENFMVASCDAMILKKIIMDEMKKRKGWLTIERLGFLFLFVVVVGGIVLATQTFWIFAIFRICVGISMNPGPAFPFFGGRGGTRGNLKSFPALFWLPAFSIFFSFFDVDF